MLLMLMVVLMAVLVLVVILALMFALTSPEAVLFFPCFSHPLLLFFRFG